MCWHKLQLQRRYYISWTCEFFKKKKVFDVLIVRLGTLNFVLQILLYDIIQVVPEPDAPLTCFKLKEIYIKEQKGPVSAITHVLGFLVTAVGQKVKFHFTFVFASDFTVVFILFNPKDLLMAIEGQRSDRCRFYRHEYLCASNGLH